MEDGKEWVNAVTARGLHDGDAAQEPDIHVPSLWRAVHQWVWDTNCAEARGHRSLAAVASALAAVGPRGRAPLMSAPRGEAFHERVRALGGGMRYSVGAEAYKDVKQQQQQQFDS